jgi:hypothetical protein
MVHRAEWEQQVRLAALLDVWLPGDAFWTATDAAGTSSTIGARRRLLGCKAGLADILIVYRGRLIAIELKSEFGRCTPVQLAVREALLAAGADWWEARSANAAMAALAESGVQFRMITRGDGKIECWRQPDLAPWEVPRRDPAEPRPAGPELAEQRRITQRRWREDQRARKAEKLEATDAR